MDSKTSAWRLIERLLITPYHPAVDRAAWRQGEAVQTARDVVVAVAAPDAAVMDRQFGVPLSRHGLQAVYVRIENRSSTAYRFPFHRLDAQYFTPLEAAARCHFSVLKRLSAFGVLGWLFAPLLLLVPLKLWTANRANRRIEALFQELSFHRRPILPGATAEGLLFTPREAGVKIVRVSLMALSGVPAGPAAEESLAAGRALQTEASQSQDVELTFRLPVPNLTVDYEHQQLAARVAAAAYDECSLPQLLERLRGVPATTSNASGRGTGDPVNLVVIGTFETLQIAFMARWDETEAITLATCWKTVRSFLLGTEYRYSPVSALYLFGRSQDIALQRTRRSINVRLHLRLWLAPFRLHGQPVWVGQVSRDIGVRLTRHTWNLTTHRIDPDVDEAREYVLDDLLDAEHVAAAGHVLATPPVGPDQPRRNLTGDPYFTDGQRAVILLAAERTRPRFVEWNAV